jgi:hypothetical protein
MPEGSIEFSGQLVNTDQFRPAWITSEPGAETLKFNNFFHEGRFWSASLSPDAEVDKFFVQIVRFEIAAGVVAAHVQYRARFKPEKGLTLKSDDGETIKHDDLVLSFEAGRPEGVAYNFFAGMKENYVLTGRVASGSQRLTEYEKDTATEQYELNLSPGEAMELVRSGIQRSHDKGLKNFYNTLRPNCVSEVFDLIDALPSVKKQKPEPFLTMVSNDPVAEPTIQALKERSVLKGRYADLRAELERGETIPPAQTDLEKNRQELLPKIEGYPYALVMMSPQDAESKAKLKELKASAYKMLPHFLQDFMAHLLVSNGGQSERMMKAFKDLGLGIKKRLIEIEKSLPDRMNSNVSLYLSPWAPQMGREVDVLKELDVAARLPFKTFDADSADWNNLNEVHMGVNDAIGAHSKNPQMFGASGAALHFHVIDGTIQISFQVIGHLASRTVTMEIDNDQVTLDEFTISDHLNVDDRPTALLTLNQSSTESVPDLNLSFGAFGGLDQSAQDLRGLMQVQKNFGSKIRSNTVPSLKGKAKVNLLGTTFKPVDVWLDVFSVDFDLGTQRVSNIDIRVSSGIFDVKTGLVKSTESDPSVNAEFIAAANAEIESRIGLSPGKSLLELVLSQVPQPESRVESHEMRVLPKTKMSCSSIL